jgi:hypothetical protein
MRGRRNRPDSDETFLVCCTSLNNEWACVMISKWEGAVSVEKLVVRASLFCS